MSKTQTKIGNAVLKSLVELKQREGVIKIEDVGSMFESIVASLQTDSEPDKLIRREIEKISKYISDARMEISSIGEEVHKEDEGISRAGAELNAVVQSTEEATNNILDAADVIMEEIEKIDNEEVSTAINDAVMEIYNACNFQDITGQRISKVISTMEYVESRINKLNELTHKGKSAQGNSEDSKSSTSSPSKKKDKRADADLCNGPQMPDVAPSQEEIDALFDSI